MRTSFGCVVSKGKVKFNGRKLGWRRRYLLIMEDGRVKWTEVCFIGGNRLKIVWVLWGVKQSSAGVERMRRAISWGRRFIGVHTGSSSEILCGVKLFCTRLIPPNIAKWATRKLHQTGTCLNNFYEFNNPLPSSSRQQNYGLTIILVNRALHMG